MKIKYHLLHEEEHTNARLGKIETNYGTYDTPMFMPVGTQATVKTLSPEEVKACNSGIILANTYHFTDLERNITIVLTFIVQHIPKNQKQKCLEI